MWRDGEQAEIVVEDVLDWTQDNGTASELAHITIFSTDGAVAIIRPVSQKDGDKRHGIVDISWSQLTIFHL